MTRQSGNNADMIVKVRKRWYDAADSVCFTLPCSDCAAKINQSGINIVGVSHFVAFTTLRNRTLAAANFCGCQVSHIQE
jgi:deoxycytidylate deaminase